MIFILGIIIIAVMISLAYFASYRRLLRAKQINAKNWHQFVTSVMQLHQDFINTTMLLSDNQPEAWEDALLADQLLGEETIGTDKYLNRFSKHALNLQASIKTGIGEMAGYDHCFSNTLKRNLRELESSCDVVLKQAQNYNCAIDYFNSLLHRGTTSLVGKLNVIKPYHAISVVVATQN